jgi:hypothetical protein
MLMFADGYFRDPCQESESVNLTRGNGGRDVGVRRDSMVI